ncbi:MULTISPECIES: hypothetical protein [unclassified Azospirillum]|uniref:hypothetical protein n=1 Tax=unclassified Azospirillum TaxID=2630922 RepID=UPI000B678E5C|nr:MULTISPECIES: hypothetical protein [unclassified Azospirillum]SNS23083.1 hypothetical protein SAMN05880556_10366 [Azospirillum sp. RU38E]SNS41194.1 hypothetical protein SAMN05880591_10366 [Azospirillum sp. RU37A]
MPETEKQRDALELVMEADLLLSRGEGVATGQVHDLLKRAAGRVFGLDGLPVQLETPGAETPSLRTAPRETAGIFRGRSAGPGRSEYLLPAGDTKLSFEMIPLETAILYVRTTDTMVLSLHIRDGDGIACERDGAVVRQLVCVWVPRHAMQEITITSRARSPHRVQILTN